ncbi:MAG TPA: DUF2079 domain-containing protein, partial [Thermoleophilia bacterium]|nr:DUF2079 domain-containing protein [Thermoleophilia bacterium]
PLAATAPAAIDPAEARRYGWYVLALAAGIALVLSLLSLQLYNNFAFGRFDMGNMTQAVYNTAHGHVLEVTGADGKQFIRLGAHVDPILVFFALPWLVWPSPKMLLVLQAVIVVAGAWPAYRLGLRVLKDVRAAALCAAALLLYPPLQYSVLNEFHPITLAIPLLLFGFLYLEEDRVWWALPFLGLAAICKEDVPLVIVTMGLYFALRKRAWWPLLISAAATAYFLFAVLVVIPHYNPGGSPFINRYTSTGSTPGDVVREVLGHPVTTVNTLLDWSNIRYLLRLLWPFAFTSLLSPLTMLIALPEFLLNGLSTVSFQRYITFHYVAAEVPFLFAAAVLGVARAHRWFGRRRVTVESLALIVLLTSLAANFLMGPLPFSLPYAKYSGKSYRVGSHAKALSGAVRMIPDGVTVSAGNTPGSQLSDRRVIFTFPYMDEAEYIVVDEKRPFWFDKPNPPLHSQALGQLVLNPAYQSVYALDGVYVFKRVE